MNKFAKIFETKEYGQILVVNKTNDETEVPEVRVFFNPKDYGVCHFGMKFNDGFFESADEFFEDFDEEKAVSFIKSIHQEMGL